MKTATKLLRWYEKEQRILPWRKTRDPYKILVSEIMLQQTQVDRVIGFYKSWLALFPDFTSLAKASNADVIQAWSGLGYNRRALALRDIAREVEKSGIPKTREEWLFLKGIGPYTSAAIALFAQHERVFPVDSIIRRVMGRFFLGKPFPDASSDELIEEKGRVLLKESDRYFDIPQALFDLGTKICSKAPDCAICPLKNQCKASKAFLSGEVVIPKRSLPKAKERVHGGKKFPDRIYRGRILKVVKSSDKGCSRQEIIDQANLGYNPDQDKQWLNGMLERLVKDNLLAQKRNKYFLPE